MTARKPKHLHRRPGPAPTTGVSPRVSVRIPADWLRTIDALPGDNRSAKLQSVIHAGLLAMIHAEKKLLDSAPVGGQ